MAVPGSSSSLSGVQRAAVFLMTLGENNASEVLRHMSPKEVQKIGEAMASITNVNKKTVGTVLSTFVESADELTDLGVGNEDYLRRVLVNALGEDKAGNIIDRIVMGSNSKGLEALKWMDPRSVAEIIRLEHPQIIAIILSYLEPDHSAEVVLCMPENMRVDTMMRIASLEGIQPSAIHELDEMLEKQFSGKTDSIRSSNVGGFKAAANILNHMELSIEAQILEGVKEADAEMGDKIQDLMFVFDNLVDVDDRGIQMLLREISSENLIVALKGADEGVKEKILDNMSKRAATMLRDDMEAKGPVRLSEVEAAQKEILSVARRMADSGELILGGSTDELIE